MSAALVFATEGVEPEPDSTPRALLASGETTVVERLCAQLRASGVREVVVVGRPAHVAALRARGLTVVESVDVAADLALIARTGRRALEPLVLAAGDLVAHDDALATAFPPESEAAVALLGTRRSEAVHPLVLTQRDRVISVGSEWHRVTSPNARFRGLLVVSADHAGQLADVCDALLEFGATGPRSVTELAGRSGVTGLVLLGLVRSGVRVAGPRVRRLVCRRVTDASSLAAAETLLSSVDVNAARLRLAVKEHDDLFATFCVSSYSFRIVAVAARLRLSPTAVTWISITFAGLAAVMFAVGNRPAALAGSVLLYLGFLFDCVDGQLARFLRRYSRYGGWLDTVADRGKEYLVYAGLAVGGLRAGLSDVWSLALAMMLLQTVRHMTDTWYGTLQESAVDRLPQASLASRTDSLGKSDAGGRSLGRRVGDALGRFSAFMQSSRGSFPYWFKRTIVFPIGERWVVIMVVAPLFGPRATFICMLVWGSVAAVYTLSGRMLRSRAMQVSAFAHHDPSMHRDDGMVARRVRLRFPPLLSAFAALAIGAVLFLLGSRVLGPVRIDATDERVVLVALAGLLLAALSASHPHDGPLDWMVAATLRAAEYAFILVIGLNDRLPWFVVFMLLGVLALHHYDLASRLDKRASPLSARFLALGWDGRALVLAAAAVFDVAEDAFYIFSGYLAAVFVVGGLFGTYVRRPAIQARPAPAGVEVISVPAQRSGSVSDLRPRI